MAEILSGSADGSGRSGEETEVRVSDGEDAKDMKYYAYYREAYGAVLDGMVGYFEQESGNDKVWLRKYGLKVFSPIAKNFPYSDFDDFGASRVLRI